MAAAMCFLLAMLLASASILIPVSCSGHNNDSHTLFIFGDSLFDAGNKRHLTEAPVPADFWPYGRFIDKPTGRFSDGYILPDFIADFLNIPHIPPINESGASFKHGASFAAAGAGVLPWIRTHEIILKQEVISFEDHIRQWSETEVRHGIYLQSIGGHDYLQLFMDRNETIVEEAAHSCIVEEVVHGIELAVRKIYDLGGRKFAFLNVAPLGCLPTVKQELNNTGCEYYLNRLALVHNAVLERVLKSLENELEEFLYSILDQYGSIHRRIDKPSIYGFKNEEASCCGVGTYNATGCAIYDTTSCPASSEYVFWDGVHNTQHVNEQLARLFWDADESVVKPQTLKDLLT